ncbi:LLM class flavin-dependent oxidoreductase [Burkholderia dolosa]|uniref:LLM class flavin-dependent oxidoreductase n=1 Tax=Burkholderia dolosa TaxID=152500 RepID=UPI001B924C6E|nr:LLM class flavin-dependent oxidoreductase [Burkholderia dolosa]MBR8457094.1 LLM class flavin-dependent oxidoreductase [Burkholderia dolosa]MDN7419407.1 LLM class flavin-dependent oxidoreductase [Burkholderia dolosa]
MTSNLNRQLRLNAFLLHTGHHIAAWRHADVPAHQALNFNYYKNIARVAEAGKFDALFLADHIGINQASGEDIEVQQRSARAVFFEPLTLLSALAVVTEHIGLIATASTSYHEPYNVARKFASLDHLSGGRAGWNVVTSASNTEAHNFGLARQTPHALRYEQAEEFVNVVRGLWDSWDEDAFLVDKASGRYFDPAKIHSLDHKGKHFEVAGPLNIARSPQGQPVVVQAGSSEPGQELAARTAEVVFTAQQTFETAKAFYKSLKDRLPRYGRSADELKIMPGMFFVVGESESHAKEKLEQLQTLLPPQVGLGLLSSQMGSIDLSPYPIDGPFPRDLQEPEGHKARFHLLSQTAYREGLTIRQLYEKAAPARGHWTVHGTAKQIVDQMQGWFEGGAADGFNVMAPTLPGGLEDFVQHVVPELQRRGLFRQAYEGSSLRDRLALPKPASKYAA